MKILINDSKIVAVVDDNHNGVGIILDPPLDFDIKYLDLYSFVDGEIVGPSQMQRLQTEITDKTQARLDDFAKTRNYDGILSACTYATSGVPTFASDGQYAVTARDNTWATLYTVMAEVQAGTRPIPSGFADVEALLPILTWPA